LSRNLTTRFVSAVQALVEGGTSERTGVDKAKVGVHPSTLPNSAIELT
jgi:hypothetical protein